MQNQLAKICEWFWTSADDQCERVVPQLVLFLLLRSFGDECHFSPTEKPHTGPASQADIRRLYALRKAVNLLELSEDHPESISARNLLLRCASSAVYLRLDEGRKFLAHLLTIEDIQESLFNAMIKQLALVGKSMANLFGTVFLLAWKTQRSDWLADNLMHITEKAIFAGAEPFGTNLRTVLSSFHANKRVLGVDLLLNRIYGPVLYRNLMVANPLVRRNAVTIMADAFPIHDPGAMIQDIESTIAFQCGKLLDLLEDPSPIVRRATVQGTCKILGLLWELVPIARAEKMLDIITSKLAFDASSAQVRLSVFEGLQFLIDNNLAHRFLSVQLPRLDCLIHDNVERIRLSFLDLLITIKAKRILSLRYFDVVPIEELLLRLPRESPAAASKIMRLILSSYFPVKRKGKSAEQIFNIQTRACISMLNSSTEAARYFYRHAYLHLSPGPLCEFAIRLSSTALEAPLSEPCVRKNEDNPLEKRRAVRTRRALAKENEPVEDENIVISAKQQKGAMKSDVESIDRTMLLVIVADVLVSITPSLAKEANLELREHIYFEYGEECLKPLLIERGNTPLSRASCWRIASCISPSKLGSIIVLWREQMDAVLEWPRKTKADVSSYRQLLAAMVLCGIRWNNLSTLSAVISRWSDCAVSGNRAACIGVKAVKRSTRMRKKQKESRKPPNLAIASDHVSSTRSNALFALEACADVVIADEEFQEEFKRVLSLSSDRSETYVDLMSTIRKGYLGTIDQVLDDYNGMSQAKETIISPKLLLQALSTTWKASLTLLDTDCENIRTIGELKEVIQWCANKDLWKKALLVDTQFPLALAGLCLGYCADAVALGHLKEEDLLLLEKIADHAVGNMQASECVVITKKGLVSSSRPVIELLRISFQLREQCDFVDNLAIEELPKFCSSTSMKRTAKATLLTACRILTKIKVEGDRTCEDLGKSILEKFFGESLLEMNANKEENEFEEAFGGAFVSTYVDGDVAEHSLLSFLTCNILNNLVTSRRVGNPSVACDLYASILRSMRHREEMVSSDKAVANFIYFLTNSMFQYYSEGSSEEPPRIPSDTARQFFAKILASVNREYPGLDEVEEDGDDVQEAVVNARKSLMFLQNITERDAKESTSQQEDDKNPDS